MDHRHSWESDSYSSNKIHRILWNSKVCYRVHKSPLLKPVSNYLNPFQFLIVCFFKICFNLILPSSPKTLKWFLPFRFSTALCRKVLDGSWPSLMVGIDNREAEILVFATRELIQWTDILSQSQWPHRSRFAWSWTAWTLEEGAKTTLTAFFEVLFGNSAGDTQEIWTTCGILDSHGGEDVGPDLLGCFAVWIVDICQCFGWFFAFIFRASGFQNWW